MDSILNFYFLDPREISAKKISQGRQDLQDLMDLFFACGVARSGPSAIDRWRMEDRFAMFVACCQLSVVCGLLPVVGC